MIQLKAHYRKSASAHTFARLMDLLIDTGGAANSTPAVGAHDHDPAKGKVHKV